MSDWIEWKGGECPVDGDTMVEVLYRDGEALEDCAECFGWCNNGDADDIVAYRIL